MFLFFILKINRLFFCHFLQFFFMESLVIKIHYDKTINGFMRGFVMDFIITDEINLNLFLRIQIL